MFSAINPIIAIVDLFAHALLIPWRQYARILFCCFSAIIALQFLHDFPVLCVYF